MARRRGWGEDSIHFEHRGGPCRHPERHNGCPGVWRGAVSLGFTSDGQRRIRRKVSGKTKTAVKDKLKALHTDLDMGISPKAGYSAYTVRQAAEDWLKEGLVGRSTKTIKKNENVLEPLLKVIRARKLRELTAGGVRRALATIAATSSSAVVTMGQLALD